MEEHGSLRFLAHVLAPQLHISLEVQVAAAALWEAPSGLRWGQHRSSGHSCTPPMHLVHARTHNLSPAALLPCTHHRCILALRIQCGGNCGGSTAGGTVGELTQQHRYNIRGTELNTQENGILDRVERHMSRGLASDGRQLPLPPGSQHQHPLPPPRPLHAFFFAANM